MAVVTRYSTVITNRDASPKVLEDAWLSGGGVQESTGYVLCGVADNLTSKYIMCTVPSNARVTNLNFQCQSLGTSCTLDIGVAYPTFIPVGSGLSAANANVIINTTVFAAALAVNSVTETTDLISNAKIPINAQEQPLWFMAGLSSDPGIDLDIVIYVHASVTTAGYVGLKAKYVM